MFRTVPRNKELGPPNPGHPPDPTQSHAQAMEANEKSDKEIANAIRMIV